MFNLKRRAMLKGLFAAPLPFISQKGFSMNTSTIKKIYHNNLEINTADIKMYRALPTAQIESLGPFVFWDHYRTANGNGGLGRNPHPHAGIEVISYLLEGGVDHSDSMGFKDTIMGGEAQFIKSGKGILHREIPHGPRHGLQLWTSLPSAHKFDEPKYSAFRANQIPVLTESGQVVKVLANYVNGIKGPIEGVSEILLAHVNFKTTSPIELAIPTHLEVGVYVLEGRVKVGSEQAIASEGDLVVFNGGLTSVKLAPLSDSADTQTPVHVAILGGAPVTDPLIFDGPFVMDSFENVQKTRRNYLTGQMGTLDGVPF
jgi:redox-sensitive bicupin YhaK (pirin superfamily)